MYTEYEFYTEQYGGSLPEQEFQRMEVRAGYYLDTLTGNRLRGHPERVTDAVKMAVCALVEELHQQEDVRKRGRVASFQNDGYSETLSYGRDSRSDTRRLRDIAHLYLTGTGLLYRGARPCG